MADKLGTFYGVGVGPGDPELLTLKAVRVLESCPVLAAPQMASGEMTALSIARQAARLEGKTLLPLRFTMSRDRAEQAEGHRRAADAVRPYLEAGQDVAMAILGDVSIYSTYCYVMELLKAGSPLAPMASRILPARSDKQAAASSGLSTRIPVKLPPGSRSSRRRGTPASAQAVRILAETSAA